MLTISLELVGSRLAQRTWKSLEQEVSLPGFKPNFWLAVLIAASGGGLNPFVASLIQKAIETESLDRHLEVTVTFFTISVSPWIDSCVRVCTTMQGAC